MNKKKWMIPILLGLGFLPISGQAYLNIKKADGQINSFELSKIRKITLNDGAVSVLAENNLSKFSLSDLLLMDFSRRELSNSIHEIDQTSNDVLVYPNPVIDRLCFKQLSGQTAIHIEVIDVHGKLVKRVEISGDESMDVSDIENGFYICRIVTDNGVLNTKFYKK